MTDLNKLRKRTEKNRKRELRAAYKRIKYRAELEIEYSTTTSCYIEVKPELRLCTWILMKKLERKGFVCELEEGDSLSLAFPNDRLLIDWGEK